MIFFCRWWEDSNWHYPINYLHRLWDTSQNVKRFGTRTCQSQHWFCLSLSGVALLLTGHRYIVLSVYFFGGLTGNFFSAANIILFQRLLLIGFGSLSNISCIRSFACLVILICIINGSFSLPKLTEMGINSFFNYVN